MDKIAVLDFGAQYGHLIARRIRELKVYSDIFEPTVTVDELKDYQGIILSGGPSSVYSEKAPKYNPEIFSLNIPILGICYGHQVMSVSLNGEVSEGKTKEYGITKLMIKDHNSIFKGMDKEEIVWMSHGDMVSSLPDGFKIIAESSECKVSAIANEEKNYYGLQFHPEVTHTENGLKIFDNFLNICNCKRSWDMASVLQTKIEEIKKQVGSRNVFLLVSGGVDSNVAFALLNKALGTERVIGLHIDNGLMRKNESENVKKSLLEHGFNNFKIVDASETFLNALKDVYEPEEKRRIIGETFIEVQREELKKLNLDIENYLLGQGTIYPDTIESKGTDNADLIKTHHNRVEIIQKLIEKGLVIEPLADLYKDEVRTLGEELGLPKNLVWRHPFPGPGLGVRILCNEEKTEEVGFDEINQKINKICSKYGLKGEVLPIKSVGVQGDKRTYSHPAVIYNSLDFDVLEKLSTELTNKIPEINRVILHLGGDTNKPTLKENCFITKERTNLLKMADDIVMKELEESGLIDKVWQFPTVLLPLSFNNSRDEAIVLRPVNSKEAMTAKFSKLPEPFINKVVSQIVEINGISTVFYDLTHKPPGTIEWE